MLDRLIGNRRRRRQRGDLAAKQRSTSTAALENARELCAVAGPWQVAVDYGAAPDASLPEIAASFAATYHGEPGVQAAAKAGALAGFDQYLAKHPFDAYD